jgi:hypothetical protein
MGCTPVARGLAVWRSRGAARAPGALFGRGGARDHLIGADQVIGAFPPSTITVMPVT